ncbi:MAG: response regulator, partial [Gemmatimonadales bacterium]
VVALAQPRQKPTAEMATEAGVDATFVLPIRPTRLLGTLSAVVRPELTPRTRRAAMSRSVRSQDKARARVLVAEDNPVNQRVASHMLNKLGYRCDIASNGKEAVDMLAQLPYDLVLMDCQMPEMDGYTATRTIRQSEESGGRHTPIIAMTANAMREDRARCLDAGMDGFIPKPIALEELETAMECWVPDDVKPGAEGGSPNASDYVFRGRGQEMAKGADERNSHDQSAPAKSFAVDPGLVAALAAQFEPHDGDRSAASSAAASAAAAASVDLTVLDNLAAMAEGGEEFVTRLIGTFVSDTSSRLVTLHVAIEAGDMSSIERTGHALKGSSGNMGATGMATIGAALQGAGQKQDVTGAKVLIDDMETEFTRVRSVLESAFPSHAVAA